MEIQNLSINGGLGGALSSIERQAGTPGTGGFDFMQYLLGLQGQAITPDFLSGMTVPNMTEEEGPKFSALSALSGNAVEVGLQSADLQSGLSGLESKDGDWLPLSTIFRDASGVRDRLGETDLKVDTRSGDVAKAVESFQQDSMPVATDLKSIQVEVDPATRGLRDSPLTAHHPALRLQHSTPQTPKAVVAAAYTANEKGNEVAVLRPKVAKEAIGEKSNDERGRSTDLSSLLPEGWKLEGNLPDATPNGSAPVSISRPMHMPEVFNQVRQAAQNGGGKITLTLAPAELGQVEIQVTTRGKDVQVEMRSENAAAKTMLESGLNDLQSALMDQDLVVQKAEVQVSHEPFQADNQFGSGAFSNLSQFSRDSNQAEQGRASYQSSLTSSESEKVRFSSNPVAAVSRPAMRDVGRLDLHA